jgi:hypothetical protein
MMKRAYIYLLLLLPLAGAGQNTRAWWRAVSAAEAAFSPASLANLAFWVHPESGILDSIGNPISEFQGAGTWQDASGKGRDVTATTVATRPIYRTGGAGGLPYLNFTGGSGGSIMAGTDTIVTGDRGRTFFIVSDRRGSADFNQGMVFSLSYASSATGAVWLITHEIATRHANVTWVSSTASPSSEASLIANRYSGGQLHSSNEVWLNKSSVALTSGTDGTINTNPAALISVGGNIGAASQRFVGRIYEIIAYDRALSDPERIKVENYLMGKYNITP